LYEEQRLLLQERRAQCGGEVEMVQEHSDHLQLAVYRPWQAGSGHSEAIPTFTKPAIVISLGR